MKTAAALVVAAAAALQPAAIIARSQRALADEPMAAR